MKKKHLRRQLEDAERQLAAAATADRAFRAEREALHQVLFDAGFLRIAGPRTRADRLRAARSGVIVLDDVNVSPTSQWTSEREVIRSMYSGDVPGPIRNTVSLEFETDGEILAALQQHLTGRTL